jgi:hypothetical protein
MALIIIPQTKLIISKTATPSLPWHAVGRGAEELYQHPGDVVEAEAGCISVVTWLFAQDMLIRNIRLQRVITPRW